MSNFAYFDNTVEALFFVGAATFLIGMFPDACVAGDIMPSQSTVLKPGLTAHAFDIEDADITNGVKVDLQIIFIEAQKTNYAPHLIGGAGKIGSERYNFPATLSEINFDNVPVIISGSYSGRFGGALQPLGYLKSGGFEISGRFHHSWIMDTVFCTDPHTSTSVLYPLDTTADKIANAAARDTFDSYEDCVQTGPQLFDNGRNVIENRIVNPPEPLQKYISTSRVQLFLCKTNSDANGPFGIGITTDKIVLSDLNKILPNLTIGSGKNSRKLCRYAAALSGSISAGLLINGSLVAGSSSALLTSGIAFGKVGAK